MKNITVEYNRGKCIGAKICIEHAPNEFSFDGEKAVLKHAKKENSLQILSVKSGSEQVKRFVKAAESCPVNAIKIIDNDEHKVLVDTEVKIDKNELKIIKAEYDDMKEFVMDEKGYFLIKISPEKKQIEVAFCPELNKVTVKIIGETPLEIYQTIIKNNLISRQDHGAYLGRELQKAYIALQKGIDYVQDDELIL